MAAPFRTRDLAWLLLLCMAATVAVLSSRGRHPGAQVEAVPPTSVSMDSPGPEPGPGPLPPTPRPPETREAVGRVFKGAVAADAQRAVAGDFNGDGAEDLAVVARPGRAALARINHELANWTLQDALAPPLDASRARPARVTVGEGDVLLAVIHGYGAGGWRNHEARQSYLVRNAVADQTRPRAAEPAGLAAGPGHPRLRGHVILDAVPGRPGFLYWSGARYVWFPLQTAGR